MYLPETYGMALLFMLISMTCWGSWANTLKLTPGWPFQLYYWDYIIGVFLTTLLWGLTLGSMEAGQQGFLNGLRQASSTNILYALLGGIVFNVANLLLVAAIEIAGLAVAFPIGIGLALVVGAVLNYLITPRGNPVLLFGGIFLVVLAIIFDAMAYRQKETRGAQVTAKGIGLSIGCGLLMGSFYPFVAKAISGESPLGPYAVGFVFAVGIVLCTIPANYFLMRRPQTPGDSLNFRDYVAGRNLWHLFGILGGFIWCTGTTLNFVAASTQMVGPAVSYAIGQGATMVSAVWGVFIWREFADAPSQARRWIVLMFLFFIIGLVAVALAPVVDF